MVTTTEEKKHSLEDKQISAEIEHLSQPFWFAEKLVQSPCKVFGVCSSIVMLCIIIVFAGGFFEFAVDNERTFTVWGDEKVQRHDVYMVAQDDYNEILEKSQTLKERSIEQDMFQTFVVYSAKKGSTLLTPQNLKTMQKVEKHLTTLKNNLYEQFCLRDDQANDGSCAMPQSVPLTISGSNDYSSTISQNQIDNFLEQIEQNEGIYQQSAFLFDKKFSRTQTNVKTARSMFKFAYPLKGFSDTQDEDDKQLEKFRKYNDELYDYFDKDQSTSTLEVTFFNPQSILDYEDQQIGKDIIFSALASVFVTIYMIIHTKSVAVGMFGSLTVYITFPVAFFFYRCIFQINFFLSLHTSILFLLMGIGADDIFVFFDSFQQAGRISQIKDDLLKRTAFSYRRASKAMLVTSLTTVVAFLATAISPIIPVMTYGIFAAINIATNYILVITLFPAFLVWREKRNVTKKIQRKVSNENNNNININNVDDVEKQNQPEEVQESKNSPVALAEIQPENKAAQISGDQKTLTQEKQTLTKIEKFFNEKWTVFSYKGRFPIIVIFLGLFIFNIIGVLQLETPKEPPSMILEGHFLRTASDSVRIDFPAFDGNSIEVNFIWGIDGLNTDNTGAFDSTDAGKVDFDSNFNPKTKANQSRFIQICEELRSSKKLVNQEIDNSISCFMKNFKNYVGETNFPVEESEFNSKFEEFLNSEQGYDTKQSKEVGFWDSKLQYATIRISGNELAVAGRDTLEPLYDEYEDLMKQINKKSQNGMNQAFQESGSYVWMTSERTLLKGAIQGIIISISLAFLIMLVSTGNIVMSFYAIVSITGVISGVIMIIWAVGWEFGTFESMNSIIVIGLAVDYIVHLVNAYVESERSKRYERTQDMLTVMGVSVLGGGVTTFGAGLFLFGGQLRFFPVMGTLVCATIGFSILWSLVFFPSLSHTIGTQGDFGNIKPFFQKIFNKRQQGSDQKQTQQIEA